MAGDVLSRLAKSRSRVSPRDWLLAGVLCATSSSPRAVHPRPKLNCLLHDKRPLVRTQIGAPCLPYIQTQCVPGSCTAQAVLSRLVLGRERHYTMLCLSLATGAGERVRPIKVTATT